MESITLRLTGYPDEFENIISNLGKEYRVIRKSGLYPNRNSDQFRMYVELERINSKEINDEHSEWSIIKNKGISDR